MSRSIYQRLRSRLLIGISVLAMGFGVLIGALFDRWLRAEFDRALEAKARALVTLTKQQEGQLELDFADEFMPEFHRPDDPEYFALWRGDGTLLERSHSFARLPAGVESSLRAPGTADAPRLSDVELPDGRSGRRVQIDFVPQIEDDAAQEESPHEEEALLPSQVGPASRHDLATLVVARSRATLDAQMLSLHLTLGGFGALLLLAIAVLVRRSLRGGLAPLEGLSRQVRSLDAGTLSQRVELEAPPAELLPVVLQINDLLGRLETAFRRERQLSSDIAHELKTPVAELRNLADVGGRWPEDARLASRFFDDARDIALNMERIVSNLLELSRLDGGHAIVEASECVVSEVIDRAWVSLERTAEEKSIRLEKSVAEAATLTTDSAKFLLIVSNLLSNAVSYSPEGSIVRCRCRSETGRLRCTFANPAPGLAPDDLDVMFDRFWRKDASRTGDRNLGLGLALVRTLAELLGLRIESELTAGRELEISLVAGPGSGAAPFEPGSSAV